MSLYRERLRNWWKRHADYPCFYCGVDLTPENRTRDHLIPISKGGSKGLDNCIQSCSTCNRDKGSMTFDEYLWLLEYREGKKNAEG